MRSPNDPLGNSSSVFAFKGAKVEEGRACEISRHQESPREQAGEGHVVFAAFGKIGGEKFSGLHGMEFLRRAACIECCEMSVPGLGQTVARGSFMLAAIVVSDHCR